MKRGIYQAINRSNRDTQMQKEAYVLNRVHNPTCSSNRRSNDVRTTKSPEIVVEIPSPKGQGKTQILRALLDSGSTGCIILNEFTQELPR
ncbi:MAG: hypothetical protein ACKOB3_03010, partial [Holophagaceae bacterium]